MVSEAVRRQVHVVACASIAAVGASAHAQWSVVFLGPVPGTSNTGVLSTDVTSQGGWGDAGAVRTAMVWSGTPESAVNLHPAGANESWVNGVHGTQQIGYAIFPSGGRASLWTGTAASWTDLTPAGAVASLAAGISGNTQVGNATFNLYPRAGLWHGTAASWVDLNPAGAYSSSALAVSGGTQVGSASFPSGNEVAGMWQGTAASWVRLGPVGPSVYSSVATCVYGNQQAGVVTAETLRMPQAAAWLGTPESWVNLAPGQTSWVRGTGRGIQVGATYVGPGTRAAMWKSTAESQVNLNTYLPDDYRLFASDACAIAFDENATYIAGTAQSRFGLRYHAVIWVGPPTPCFMVNDPAGILFCPRDSGGGELTVSTIGSLGTLTYQWTRNGEPVDVSQNPSAATATIAVSGPDSGGEYRCIITDSCGSVTSGPATVSVCFAEFNCDGFLDFFDYDDFVTAFEAGDPAADVNGDAFLDFFDYDDFVAAFETGC